jgi:HlyD family secretion protein
LVANRSMNQAVLDEKLSALESAESALAVAQATVQSTEADVRVQQALELQARADLARAEAQLKVAEADLAHLQILIGYSQIIAPFDGLVIERSIDTGDFVSSAASNSPIEPLFVVDRDEKLRIVFDVPESQSSLVHIGQRASLEVDALKGRTFEGAVARTAGVLNPKTRTLRAEVELATTAALRPGMYGMVTIELANEAQALTKSR